MLRKTIVISVPHNTADLVVVLSKSIAESKAGLSLTLEFLLEALSGFQQVSPRAQYKCIQYMKPWIPNLKSFIKDETKTGKLKQFINLLTTVSCKFKQMLPTLNEIWAMFTEDKSMLEIALNGVIEYGLENGLKNVRDPKLEAVNDLIVTFAAVDAKFVSQTLLDLIIDKINQIKGPFSLQEPTWAKITILTRYLMQLSFQDRFAVLENLPRLMYIIILLVGTGDLYFRTTVLALCANMIHSLSIRIEGSQETRQKIL